MCTVLHPVILPSGDEFIPTFGNPAAHVVISSSGLCLRFGEGKSASEREPYLLDALTRTVLPAYRALSVLCARHSLPIEFVAHT